MTTAMEFNKQVVRNQFASTSTDIGDDVQIAADISQDVDKTADDIMNGQ